MLASITRIALASVALLSSFALEAQTPAARGQAPRARRRERHRGQVLRRLRPDVRTAPHPRARPVQPHAVLQRQGHAARRDRRPDARVRAAPEQEVREADRQAADHAGHDPDHARRDVRRRRGGPRGHRRRQPLDHRVAPEEGRLRLPAGSAGHERGDRHRPEVAGAGVHRRPGRQDDPHAQGRELPRDDRTAEPALRQGRQAADTDRRSARRARGRGQARNAGRGPARARGRGRLEGKDLGAGPEGREDPRRPRAEEGREGRLGDPQGQPEAEGRDRGVHAPGAQDGFARDAPQDGLVAREEIQEQHRGRRTEALRGHHRAVPEVRREVRLRSADARRAGLPGVAAATRTRRATSARSASCRSCRPPARS